MEFNSMQINSQNLQKSQSQELVQSQLIYNNDLGRRNKQASINIPFNGYILQQNRAVVGNENFQRPSIDQLFSPSIKSTLLKIVKQLPSRKLRSLQASHFAFINDKAYQAREDESSESSDMMIVSMLLNKNANIKLNAIFPDKQGKQNENMMMDNKQIDEHAEEADRKAAILNTEVQPFTESSFHNTNMVGGSSRLQGIQTLQSRRAESINQSNLYRLIKFIKSRNILQQFVQHCSNLSKQVPVFNPSNNFKLIWDLIQFSVTGCFVFFIPVRIIYQYTFRELMGEYFVILFLSMLILDWLFYLNMGIYKKGALIKDRVMIFKYWMKKMMLQDFISIFPLVINIYYEFQRDEDQTSSNQILSYFMLLFYGKVGRLMKIANKLQETFVLSVKVNNVIGLIKLLIFAIFMGHVFASVFLQISIYEKNNDHPNSWLKTKSLLEEPWDTQYLYSYYYATVTMLTIGYGDITPTTNIEMLYCIVLMFVACGVFGYTLNSINQIFDSFYKQESEKKYKLCLINSYMQKKNVAKDLQYQIREYLNYVWKESSENLQDEKIIIGQLSNNLREKLLLDANKIVLQYSPVFKENFSSSVLQKTGSLIYEFKCTPEEIVYRNGDQDNCAIYFVLQGSVDIIFDRKKSAAGEFYPSKNQPVREFSDFEAQNLYSLKRGQSFGMQSFFTGQPRIYSIRSKEFTTFLVINRSDFLSLLQQYPSDYERFCHIKDSILMYQRFDKINMKCFSCGQFNHTINNCPLIHYQANRYLIVEKVILNTPQTRMVSFNRKLFKFSAISQQNMLINDLLDFHEDYEQELDNYEEVNGLLQQFNQPLNQEEIQSINEFSKENFGQNNNRGSIQFQSLAQKKSLLLNEVKEEYEEKDSPLSENNEEDEDEEEDNSLNSQNKTNKTVNHLQQHQPSMNQKQIFNFSQQNDAKQLLRQASSLESMNHQQKFQSFNKKASLDQLTSTNQEKHSMYNNNADFLCQINKDNTDDVDFLTLQLDKQQQQQSQFEEIDIIQFENEENKYPQIIILTPEDWETNIKQQNDLEVERFQNNKLMEKENNKYCEEMLPLQIIQTGAEGAKYKEENHISQNQAPLNSQQSLDLIKNFPIVHSGDQMKQSVDSPDIKRKSLSQQEFKQNPLQNKLQSSNSQGGKVFRKSISQNVDQQPMQSMLQLEKKNSRRQKRQSSKIINEDRQISQLIFPKQIFRRNNSFRRESQLNNFSYGQQINNQQDFQNYEKKNSFRSSVQEEPAFMDPSNVISSSTTLNSSQNLRKKRSIQLNINQGNNIQDAGLMFQRSPQTKNIIDQQQLPQLQPFCLPSPNQNKQYISYAWGNTNSCGNSFSPQKQLSSDSKNTGNIQYNISSNDLLSLFQQMNQSISLQQAQSRTTSTVQLMGQQINDDYSNQINQFFFINFDQQKNFQYYFPHNNLNNILNALYYQYSKKQKNIGKDHQNSLRKVYRSTIFLNQIKKMKRFTGQKDSEKALEKSDKQIKRSERTIDIKALKNEPKKTQSNEILLNQ